MAIHVIGGSLEDGPQPSRNRVSSAEGWTDGKVLVAANANHRVVVHAMTPVLLAGKWLGFLAFRGLHNPKFVWVSFRSAYMAATFAGMVVQFAVGLVPVNDTTGSPVVISGFRRGGSVIYFGVSVFLLLLYVRFCMHWPGIVGALKRLERRLAEYPQVEIGPHIRNAAVASLVANSMIEIVLDLVPYIQTVVRDAKYESYGDFFLELSYKLTPALSACPEAYCLALALWLFWVRLQTKYVIVYCDLLLAAFSRVLAALFGTVKHRVRTADVKAMTDRDWRDVRETYHEVLTVTTEANRVLGPLILVSYMTGLWFICGGILMLLAGAEADLTKRAYLFASMCFWSLRVLLATLAMSAVFDENKGLRRHLHAVPTALYSYEVNRLTMQACNNELGLTGMDFFTVTRSVLLTLVGTVASYEVVLMQFSR